LETAEEDEGQIERSADAWLVETLQLKKRPYSVPDRDPFRLSATKHTLIPRMPWQSELGADDSLAYTWKRRIATRRTDVTLLRPGTPLVDVVQRFTRWDDRGTAFVTYRTDPTWRGGLWVGFKLCFVIEPAIELTDLLAPTRAELALWRRAQRYLAPRAHTIFIDVNGENVVEPKLLAILEEPYRKTGNRDTAGGDINLGSRPNVLAEIIDLSIFSDICRRVRDNARTSLAAHPDIAEEIATGLRLAQADVERNRYRLLRRQSDGDQAADSDFEFLSRIVPSISKPSIRLDAMGCFIVAPHPPSGGFRD
jgi:ATP-dependent helicase HepA